MGFGSFLCAGSVLRSFHCGYFSFSLASSECWFRFTVATRLEDAHFNFILSIVVLIAAECSSVCLVASLSVLMSSFLSSLLFLLFSPFFPQLSFSLAFEFKEEEV